MGTFIQNKEGITSEKDSKTELNIFTCGNSKEIMLFNQKEIRVGNHLEQDLDFFEENHPTNDWYFDYYLKELNADLIEKIINDIIEKHKTKRNFKNNIILIFFDLNDKNDETKNKIQMIKEIYDINDKNKETKNKIQMILEKFDKIQRIYKPILFFAFKKIKKELEEENKNGENQENLIKDIIKEKKFDNYYIKKYIEIVYYNENDYSEIIKKLESLYCYFNNIGDLFSVLDEMIRGYNFYDGKERQNIKYTSTINILVLGRPGSGKSTLINLLLNKRKAKEGIGDSVTKVVSKYVHDEYPLTFEDTPGFEDDHDLGKMIKFLNDSNNIFKRGKNKFHLILYIINGSNERTFIGEEVKLINFIEKNMKIPIFFVCTRTKNEEYARDFEEVVKMNLWQNFGNKTNLVNHIYCCHLLNEKDGVYKRFGINKLLDGIKNFFLNEIEKKENELKLNENNGLFSDINVISDDPYDNSTFLSGLSNPKKFEDYLRDLSSTIISEYEYLTYLEELKKNKTQNKINDDKIKYNEEKIIELLIDHLALELNGKSKGYTYYKRYSENILSKVDNYEVEPNKLCGSKTQDEEIKNITITDENIKNSIRITREYGIEATNDFLKDIQSGEGFESYLNDIIKSYKTAIESLKYVSQKLDE